MKNLKLYAFRTLFYVTAILSGFALAIDYDNSEFSSILILLVFVIIGCSICYNVLHGKNDKEVSKILGIPESLFSE